MKRISPPLFLSIILLFAAGCTSQKKLAYLNNLPDPDGQEYFTMEIPDYKIQPRDILYITAKAMGTDGKIEDLLNLANSTSVYQMGGEGSGSYLLGYDVNLEGYVRIPVVGMIKVDGLELDEIRKLLQESVDKVFKNAAVECKLLSFKFTVLGEVKTPGTYTNYNNYLTVLEAIGRAGGIDDYGKRDRVLVVRPTDKGSKTYRLNLQDKSILNSDAYFLLPNDVVIVEPQPQKVFNLNLPTISFIIASITSTITMTILLVDYLK
jgi:polysaccharide export outer membrane protein